MSDTDKKKWDARYQSDTFAGHGAPNSFLQRMLSEMAPGGAEGSVSGAALDVACGAGRNAVYLAQRGFVVDAVDVSTQALTRGSELAARTGVSVNWQAVDLLDSPAFEHGKYQLIVMLHFVAPDLLRRLPDYLAAGGYLLVEEHLQWPDPVAGPGSNRFRVAPGALKTALADVDVMHYFEGLSESKSGTTQALAQVFARKQ